MVRLEKIRKGDYKYYVLVHSVRKGGKVTRLEKHIGKELPDNIVEIKEDFSHELFLKIYGDKLKIVKEAFQDKKEKMTNVEIEKEVENFGIVYTYDSNKMEGSTLTQNETRVLLLHGISPNKPLKDILEHKAHFELIKVIKEYEGKLNLNTIVRY